MVGLLRVELQEQEEYHAEQEEEKREEDPMVGLLRVELEEEEVAIFQDQSVPHCFSSIYLEES